ncbi:MAG: ABC transporter permease [Bryobacteraceae bacterium]|jgi:putative ABC transport system permease protein
MPLSSRIASLRRNLFTQPRVERELDDELRAYLDQLAAENRATGMDAVEAMRAARIELGGLEQVKGEVRQEMAGRMFEEFVLDLRYGARTLRKNAAFTAVAVLALALGIGANTAMFSVAYGILFRPLPYADASRVAVVAMRFFPRDFAFGTMCIRDYLLWKENNRAFEDPSLFRGVRMDIGGAGGVPEQVQGAAVTAGFFSTLGVRPLVGRMFRTGEDKPATGSLAVLSESLWRRRFGGSAAVLGRAILVNGLPPP